MICQSCGAEFPHSVLSPYMCHCGNRTYFEGGPEPEPPPSSPPPLLFASGPGTELSKLIPEIFSSSSCNCKKYAAKMDRWGVEGCEARFERIVKRLVIRSRRKAFIKYFPRINAVILRELLRKAIDNAKLSPGMSAVWVYWEGGAESDELLYSIRCAYKNLGSLQNIVVCGDIPSWYSGYGINSPRLTKAQAQARFRTGRWAKVVDSIIKLQRIIDDPNVTENFLWLYDDTFIVQPISIPELSIPKYGGYLPTNPTPAKHSWREALRRTGVALSLAGFEYRNYSTHYPVVYNKKLLQETINVFRPDVKPRVIESLYLNHHRSPYARPLDRTFQYNKGIHEGWAIRPAARVVNVGGFKPPVRELISTLYPTPCPYERG